MYTACIIAARSATIMYDAMVLSEWEFDCCAAVGIVIVMAVVHIIAMCVAICCYVLACVASVCSKKTVRAQQHKLP